MSSDGSSIERAVVDECGARPGGLLGAEADAEQIDLALEQTDHGNGNVFRLMREQERSGSKGGRPKGSRNKVSDTVAKVLAHKGIKDPVEYMAEIYNMPFDQLVELVKRADDGKMSKRGDIAIKVLNIQLSAAKSVAEYVHSKRPTQAVVQMEALPTIVMPGAGSDKNFDAADETTRLAGDLIAKALAQGKLEPADLHGMEMRDGQLLIEGQFIEIDDEGDGGDDA